MAQRVPEVERTEEQSGEIDMRNSSPDQLGISPLDFELN
jgi:hypothetical protein